MKTARFEALFLKAANSKCSLEEALEYAAEVNKLAAKGKAHLKIRALYQKHFPRNNK